MLTTALVFATLVAGLFALLWLVERDDKAELRKELEEQTRIAAGWKYRALRAEAERQADREYVQTECGRILADFAPHLYGTDARDN